MSEFFPKAAVLGAGPAPFPWPPPLRAPLSPFPPVTSAQGSAIVWASAPYRTTLVFTPPDHPTNEFLRANFCGTRVPGLRWLPGMGGNPSTGPTLCMDLDVAKYGPDDTASQDLFIEAKIASGCTHVQISLGDFAQQGWTIAQTVAWALRLKARGFFVDVWVLGGGGGFGGWAVRDSMWAQNAPLVTPWLEAFIAAGAIDRMCVGWQLDGWLGGTPCVDNIIGLCELVKGRVAIKTAHWIRDGNAWWDDATCAKYGICDRFSFWAFMKARDYLNRTEIQVDVNAPVSAPDNQGGPNGGIQGAIRDICRALQPGQKADYFEYAGQDQFDRPDQRSEASGNMRGFLGLCAGPEMGGFGNGCQFPDGHSV